MKKTESPGGEPMQNPASLVSLLACPETKQTLRECSLEDAKTRMESDLDPLREAPEGSPSPPFGATPRVMLRGDLRRAYPVVYGVPILLAPEILGPPKEKHDFDLEDPKYAEAYEEMAFYNEVSSREAEDIRSSESYLTIEPTVKASPQEISSFPAPRSVWLDAPYDCAAQWDAYAHIAPVEGKRVLQLGGKGTHAVKLLLAGASEAWAATPMLGEARCAMALARTVGVADRLRCVVALAEELPFAEGSFDVVYSGGSMHHMVTGVAMPEVARVLRKGGKFAAMDPWRAPLYAIGTKMLGKREPDVYCRPLTKERVEPLKGAFSEAAVIQHGALTRYPLLALDKLGFPSSLSTVWRMNKIDDAVCSLVPGLRAMGSSVACLGAKRERIAREHKKETLMTPEEATRLAIERFPFEGYIDPAKGAHLNVARAAARHLRPGSKVLDFGCGPCDKTAILQLLGFECSGYDDLRDDWHTMAGNRGKILAFAKECGVDFKLRETDSEPFPFEKGSFDMVMLHDVLEHLHESPRDLLNDLLELLKPEGLLFVTVPNAANIRKRIHVLFGKTNLPRFDYYYWNPGPWRGHVREYVKDDLRRLSEYLDLEALELRGCDHMLDKVPSAARSPYLSLTRFSPGLKDSWSLVAKKRPGWSPRRSASSETLGTIRKGFAYHYE